MTSSHTPKLIWSGVVILLLILLGKSAQHSNHTQNQSLETGLKGTIFDQLEARVGRARITVASKALKRELESDEWGSFSLKIPPGTYQLIVESPGFEVAKKKIRVGEGISEIRIVLKAQKIKYGKCPKELAPCIWL